METTHKWTKGVSDAINRRALGVMKESAATARWLARRRRKERCKSEEKKKLVGERELLRSAGGRRDWSVIDGGPRWVRGGEARGLRFCSWRVVRAYLVTPSILASSLPCSLCSTLPPAPPIVI